MQKTLLCITYAIYEQANTFVFRIYTYFLQDFATEPTGRPDALPYKPVFNEAI